MLGVPPFFANFGPELSLKIRGLLIGDTLKKAREDLKVNKNRNLEPHKLYSLIFKFILGGVKFFLTTYLLVSRIIFKVKK